MPYDYQTGEEWQDGERVTRRPNFKQPQGKVILDPQTGQEVWVATTEKQEESAPSKPS